MIRKIIPSLRRSWIYFYEHFTDHQARAATLSYYTLFALLPFLVLILLIARGFFLENEIILFLLKTFKLEEKVITILLTMAFSAISGTKGIIFVGSALALYLWSSFTIISKLEKNFNELLQFKEDRAILQRLYVYPLLLLFYPFASLFLNAFTLSLTGNLIQGLLTSSFSTNAVSYVILLIHLLSPLLTAFLLGIGYYAIPNGKIEWRHAFYAGLIAAVLYQFLHWGFFYFQHHMLQNSPIWGAFAIFPLFLLWVNLNWLIILLGGEVLASLHRPKETPEPPKELLP